MFQLVKICRCNVMKILILFQTMIEEAKVLEQKLKIDSLSTSIESTSVIIKR